MRTLTIVVVLIAILIAGGGISAFLAANNGVQTMPAGKVQTADPEASVFVATDWQAQQFFLMIGFLVVNLIGMGLTIALIMWFLSRGISSVQGGSGSSEGEPANAIQTTE